MNDTTARLAAQISVPVLIALALEDLGRLPVPHKLLRTFVYEQYGRDFEPQAIAVALQHAKRASRKRKERHFLVPALREDGSHMRGWVTHTAWLLSERIVPYGADPLALRRVMAAAEHKPIPPWDPERQTRIAQSAAFLSKSSTVLCSYPRPS